jgi:hypothetical protein
MNENLPGTCLQDGYTIALHSSFRFHLSISTIKASHPIIYLKKTMTV